MTRQLASVTSIDDVLSHAEQNGLQQYQSAVILGSPLSRNETLWPVPKDLSDLKHDALEYNLVGSHDDIISCMARELGKCIKFPVNTAFMHALGVVASAMTKSFYISAFGGELPVNLYVIGAQPPSTGKSGVNGYLTRPIRKAYSLINDKNIVERRSIERRIKIAQKDIEKAGDDDFREQQYLLDLEKDLEATPIYRPILTDATPESLESEMAKQGGFANVVSAEAEAVTVLLGCVYGDNAKVSNMELVLKGWDNEHVSSSRITRKGLDGPARMTIAVLAQGQTVDSVLKLAELGRGIAERFLLIKEANLLGHRKDMKSYSMPTGLLADYETMISNMVNEDKVVLAFDSSSKKIIEDYKASIEPKLADGGEYEHDILTGFMGKADKQVMKIAAILHGCKEWAHGGSRSNLIGEDETIRAIAIFDAMAQTYIHAASTMGYMGVAVELEKLIEYIEFKAKKTNKMRINELRNNIKKKQPFAGARNLTNRLKDKLLPMLERAGYIYVHGAVIHINPRLK